MAHMAHASILTGVCNYFTDKNETLVFDHTRRTRIIISVDAVAVFLAQRQSEA